MIQETIAVQCQKVVDAQADYKMLETDHTTRKVLAQAREKAKEKFDAQQAQASKPRRGRPPKKRS